MRILIPVMALSLLLFHGGAYALEAPVLRIAVSANFSVTAEKLAKDFEQKERVRSEIISGSSGKLSAQITHGAPFDILLSADRSHPQELLDNNLVRQNKISNYAIGILVFITKESHSQKNISEQIKACRKIAIASPEHAPYGKAAMQALEYLKLVDSSKPKVVIGESIGQAMSFLETGAADCGFVGLSQVKAASGFEGRYTIISSAMHKGLMQSAVLLENGKQPKAAQKFMEYLLSETARAQIKEAGYELP